ncbi:MAG: DUF1273 family protein [Clostridia bacterium]|nr:DUF1273 family protein [Clostridia bacterium]
MNIEKEKTCCFTGHRVLKKDINVDNVDKIIQNLINKGINTFLVGMALGFDLLCFERLLLKKDQYIRIIACIPCRGQEQKYPLTEKERYNKYIEQADEKIYLFDEYENGCMFVRNRFMVDNSAVLVAYIYKKLGGAYYTVNYAEKRRKEIIYI